MIQSNVLLLLQLFLPLVISNQKCDESVKVRLLALDTSHRTFKTLRLAGFLNFPDDHYDDDINNLELLFFHVGKYLYYNISGILPNKISLLLSL